MKNKGPEIEENLFRRKGFFIALYSCLGAVAILALVITIANFGPLGFQAGDYEEDAAYVGYDQVAPYLAEVDEEAWFRPRQSPTPPPQEPAVPPQTTPRPTPPPRPVLPEQEAAPPESELPPSPPPQQEAYYDVYEQPYEGRVAATGEMLHCGAPTASYFEAFTEAGRLLWPVSGDIAMQFSMESLIYDPTLDQFRTNDNLRIYSEEGTHVQASAAGRVLAVGRNIVRGNYVRIDHGNGWVITYGQLGDTRLVVEGEYVMAGQVIGTVGQPSMFGSMHGPHVNLHVTRDDVPVDPYAFLAAR